MHFMRNFKNMSAGTDIKVFYESEDTKLKRNIKPRTYIKSCIKCAYCPRVFETYNERQKHLQTHTELSYHCSYCPSSFADKSQYTAHLYVHTGEFPFKCTQCPKRYLKESELKKHFEVHIIANVQRTKVPKPFYSCLLCPGLDECNCSKIESKTPIQCAHCPRVFVSAFDLNIHMQIHTNQLAYKCPYCPVSFAHKPNIISHMYEHTKYYRYKCHKCWRSYKYKGELVQHMREKHHMLISNLAASKQMETTPLARLKPQAIPIVIEDQEKPSPPAKTENPPPLPNICLYCKKTFTQKDQLLQHVSEVHILHKCIYCRKEYTYRSDLLRHVCEHAPQTTSKPTHKCIYCPLEFRYQYHLFKHVNDKHPGAPKHKDTRDNATMHRCSYCPKEFWYRRDLFKHVDDKHADVQKHIMHKCIYCAEEFRYRQHLFNHVSDRHSEYSNLPTDNNHQEDDDAEDMLYECIHCSKEFTKREDLVQHAQDMHPQNSTEIKQRHVCDYCYEEFDSRLALDRHIDTHSANAISIQEGEEDIEFLCEPNVEISTVEEPINVDPLTMVSTSLSDKNEKPNIKKALNEPKKVSALIKFLKEEDSSSPKSIKEEEPVQSKPKKSPKPKQKICEKNVVTRLYRCNYCTKNFTRLQNLKQHMSSHADKSRITRSYKYKTHTIF